MSRAEVARFLAESYSRFSVRRQSAWKRTAARVLALASGTTLRLLLLLPVREDVDQLARIAEAIVSSHSDVPTIVSEATRFVHGQVEFFHTTSWLSPSRVLAVGVGDCKNQAAVLHALLGHCGIGSEIVVGLTNRQEDLGGVHAWTTVTFGGEKYFCDPTVSAVPMSEEEFARATGGFLDISPEYLLREPQHKQFFTGTLTSRI